MAALDELGYLTAPHTSAGRVPTERGYRYFVKRLLDNETLPANERIYIAERFQTLPLAIEHWLHGAARQLARTVHIAALATPPVAETSRFKHIELIAIQGRLCLMVLVLQDGSVHQQMLNLREPVAQTNLSAAATRINDVSDNLNAKDTPRKGIILGLLERDMCELAAELMERADSNLVRMIYRDGLSEMVGTFAENEGAQQALRVFEESAVLNVILNEIILPREPNNEVRVVIAGEGKWEELSHLSMVVSRYGIPGQASGAVGLFGPTNLDYARAVSAVRYVAALMTAMLEDVYQGSSSEDTPSETPKG
jgi:heat-inducible transcriptional repressor